MMIRRMDFPAVLKLEDRTRNRGDREKRGTVPKVRIRVAATAVLDVINNSNNVTTPVLTTVPKTVLRSIRIKVRRTLLRTVRRKVLVTGPISVLHTILVPNDAALDGKMYLEHQLEL